VKIPNIDENMGQEALNRLLKAKLTVLQQDYDKMTKLFKSKESSTSGMENKLKTVTDEKNAAVKSLSSMTGQLEKMKGVNVGLKGKSEALEASLITIRRDHESTARTQKQQATDTTAQTLRLNRSLEEIERHKTLLAKNVHESREKIGEAKKSADGLMAELKKSERRITELMLVVKKQRELIEVLQRQKVDR
jgi:chromosome segregation ATPase